MAIVMDRGGQVVRRSRNLRGLVDHARRSSPVWVSLKDTDGRAMEVASEAARTAFGETRRYELLIQYADGTTGRDFFADWRVAASWLRAKRRAWGILPAESDVPGFLDAYQSLADRMALRVRGLAAWNHTPEERAAIVKATRNQHGLAIRFRDKSRAFIPAGTAEVRA